MTKKKKMDPSKRLPKEVYRMLPEDLWLKILAEADAARRREVMAFIHSCAYKPTANPSR